MQKKILFSSVIALVFTAFLSGSCNEDSFDEYGAEVRELEDTCSCKIGVGQRRIIDIVSNESEYQYLVNNLDFLTLSIGRIYDDYSLEDMQKLVAIVEEQEMEVIVELGGLLGPGWGGLPDIDNGKLSAQSEINRSRNWIRAGGKIDYIIFDGPIRRLLYGNIPKNISENNGVLVSGHFNENRGPFSYEEAADEILSSMAEWRKEYPEIEFILGCNFPNWGWKGQQDYHKRQADGMNWGDYWEVVQVVMNKVQSTATSFNAMIIDFPYNYAVGEKSSPTPGNDPTAIDWIARILEMEEYVKGLGLEFHLYTNTEEQESNIVYSEGTLKYVDLYRQRGGAPDGWNVKSWYDVPTNFGPESQQYSMSWLTNRVIKKLREPGTDEMNVLMIMTDQHTFSALGAAGNEQINTPNLDRLKADGAFFTHCIAPTPDCSPARASILSGLSTHNHGIWNNVDENAGLPGLDDGIFPITENILYGLGHNTLHWGKLHVCNTNTRPKDYITSPWYSNTDFHCYASWPLEISGKRDAALESLNLAAYNRGHSDWEDWNSLEHVSHVSVIAQASSSYVSDIGKSPVPAIYTREFAFGEELMEAISMNRDYRFGYRFGFKSGYGLYGLQVLHQLMLPCLVFLHPVGQGIMQDHQCIIVIRVPGKVVFLQGIRLKVIQMWNQVFLVIPPVFPPVVSYHVLRIGLLTRVIPHSDHLITPGSSIPFNKGPKTAAINTFRDKICIFGVVQYGRHDVHGSHQFIHDHPSRDLALATQDQGYPDQRFKKCRNTLPNSCMRAGHIAVVGSENNQGPLSQTQFIQLVQHLPYHLINHGNLPIVDSQELPSSFFSNFFSTGYTGALG